MRTPELAAFSAAIASLLASTHAAAAPARDDAPVDVAEAPPEPSLANHEAEAESLGAPPPVRPRHKGLVLESSVGALGFAGHFRQLAPPAYWFRAQLGYELLRPLMVFASAEMALTTTGEGVDASQAMVFPIWGFGGGVRGTLHVTDRVALLAQGEVDALEAIVPHRALAILGYGKAESLAPAYALRVGVEWYQVDRHFALFAAVGARYAPGFERQTAGASGDLALLWDAAGGVRYTF